MADRQESNDVHNLVWLVFRVVGTRDGAPLYEGAFISHASVYDGQQDRIQTDTAGRTLNELFTPGSAALLQSYLSRGYTADQLSYFMRSTLPAINGRHTLDAAK